VIQYSNRKIYLDAPAGWIPKFKERREICEDMNNLLINNWNSVIQPLDEVYHLGDFSFAGHDATQKVLDRLHGIKYLIRGNHDYDFVKRHENEFVWIKDYYVLKVHDKTLEEKQYHQHIVMCHFPFQSWENMTHGFWHLHGHSHGKMPSGNTKRYDVGVDNNNLMPISYQQVKEIMRERDNISRPDRNS